MPPAAPVLLRRDACILGVITSPDGSQVTRQIRNLLMDLGKRVDSCRLRQYASMAPLFERFGVDSVTVAAGTCS